MPEVTISLPTMLRRFVDEQPSITVEAPTLADALTTLTHRYPPLEVHLVDETGDLRPHVLCFHNDTNSRWLESLEVPLHEGDRITIMQAVSGG